jgi:hypothetical protein
MGKTYKVGPARAFEPINTGDYRLTFKGWEETTVDRDGRYSKKGDPQVRITWIVDVPNRDEETIRRVDINPPATWNSKSNWVKIAEALGLVDHEKAVLEGAEMDWDNAINRQCMGSILKHYKEEKPTELTDSIKAYSPMPAKPVFGRDESSVPLAPAPRSNPLLARAKRMNMFAGKPDNLTPEMNSQVLATHLRSLGAEPMNDTAVRMLIDAQDLLQLVGGTVPEIDKSETIEQGLKALDVLEKAMEALE